MKLYNLGHSTHFDMVIGDQMGAVWHWSIAKRLCDCSFPESSHIWLLSSQDDPCSICDFLGMVLRVAVIFPHVGRAGVASTLSVCGITAADSLLAAVLYFISLSWKQLAVSANPGCVNWSSHIYFCWTASMCCCTSVEIVAITQLGSWSSLSLPSSESSSSLFSSSPSLSLLDIARLLWLSPIAFNISRNGFLDILFINPAFAAHIFLLLLNRCPWIFNFLPYYSSFSFHTMLDLFLLLIDASKVSFLAFIHWMVLCRSQAAQCTKYSGPIVPRSHSCHHSLDAVVGWNVFCGFDIFTCRDWWMDRCRRIDRCILYCLCCWVRCWTLQDMDPMEASCVGFVRVGTFDQVEERIISVLTTTTLGILMLTITHDLIFIVCFRWNPRDVMGQTLPDVLSVKDCPFIS